jgi:hypothetical protein
LISSRLASSCYSFIKEAEYLKYHDFLLGYRGIEINTSLNIDSIINIRDSCNYYINIEKLDLNKSELKYEFRSTQIYSEINGKEFLENYSKVSYVYLVGKYKVLVSVNKSVNIKDLEQIQGVIKIDKQILDFYNRSSKYILDIMIKGNFYKTIFTSYSLSKNKETIRKKIKVENKIFTY